MGKIKLNDVLDVMSKLVPNAREIVHFNLTKKVNPYEKDILTVSVNTFGLYNDKDFNIILNTIRYCGLSNINKIGYADKNTTFLDIDIDVTNLTVHYEYEFLDEAGGLRKLSIK